MDKLNKEWENRTKEWVNKLNKEWENQTKNG